VHTVKLSIDNFCVTILYIFLISSEIAGSYSDLKFKDSENAVGLVI